ncbi:uncharacterized protein LOC135114675 isoform X1 [Scylla paramamosain]|uniref:uncharacterized protein LOC135114675 isoform X1 n=1 Tax=Scylla paramamosain TaxID=85552 RepID=UPI0030831176
MCAGLPSRVLVMVVMVLVMVAVLVLGNDSVTPAEAQQGFKVLEIPKEEDKGNVTYHYPLDASRSFNAFTVCLRMRPTIFYFTNNLVKLTLGNKEASFVFHSTFQVKRIWLTVADVWIHFPLSSRFRILRWYHLCFIHDPSRRELVTVVDGHTEYRAAIAPPTEPLRADMLYLASGPSVNNKNYVGDISQVNVWTRALATKEILELAECHKDLAGDYVSWKDMELPGLTPRTVPHTLLCPRHNNTIYFVFPSILYATARYLCTALGSSLPQPATWEDVTALVSLTHAAGLSYVSRYAVWMPISDEENEGIWRSALDEDAAPVLLWSHGEPNGFTYENCAYVSQQGIHDASCEDATATAVCRVEDLPVFILHNTEKTLMSFVADQNEAKELVFRGFDGSAIVKVNGFWSWEGPDNKTLAVLSDEHFQFPMGGREWHTQEGSSLMLLTACPDGHFTCNDASCIPMEHHCDSKFDCKDMSDEDSCVNVLIRSAYQNWLPPHHDARHMLIAITFHVMTVSVSTEDMHLELTFNLSLSWTDKRLQFYNLKESRPNWLTHDDLQEMWTPHVLFPNAKGNEYTIVDQNTVGHVSRNCKPDITGIMAAHEVEVFSGSCNPITVTRRYKMRFNCEFDLLLYPFDQQTCQVPLLFQTNIRDYVKFSYTQSQVKYTGPSKLREYEVDSVLLRPPNVCKDQSDICFEVPLRRLSSHAVLTMYTPSLILLFLSYITLFFNPAVFEVRIMATLTSLLVMATIFTQSSSSLPTTSYIKMLDLWLLTCILLVFLIVIFHTFIEHYRLLKKGESEGKAWATRVVVGCLSPPLDLSHAEKCSQDPQQKAPSTRTSSTTTTASTTMDSLVWAAKITLPVVFLIFLIAYLIFIITFNSW